MAARRATKKPAQSMTNAGESTRITLSEYNAVIDLQIAMRDRIKRPISMLEALQFAAAHVRTVSVKVAAEWADLFDVEHEEAARNKREQQARISQEADKR